MNTKNNRRRKASREAIETVFLELLQTRELGQVTVSDICKQAHLNRSTFYANYTDIYELADSVRERLEGNMGELYADEIKNGYNSNDYLRLFRHIRENPLLYRTYFKLGYDSKYRISSYDAELAKRHFGERLIEYHMEFFRSGFTAIVKMWLQNGCLETPEEMNEIILSEYRGREANVADPGTQRKTEGENNL